MTDNKKKTVRPDSYLISFKEKYEFDYAVKQLKKEFPEETKQELKEALTDAAIAISPSEGRKKIMRRARKNLQN